MVSLINGGGSSLLCMALQYMLITLGRHSPWREHLPLLLHSLSRPLRFSVFLLSRPPSTLFPSTCISGGSNDANGVSPSLNFPLKRWVWSGPRTVPAPGSIWFQLFSVFWVGQTIDHGANLVVLASIIQISILVLQVSLRCSFQQAPFFLPSTGVSILHHWGLALSVPIRKKSAYSSPWQVFQSPRKTSCSFILLASFPISTVSHIVFR